jgi:hypothetical protein
MPQFSYELVDPLETLKTGCVPGQLFTGLHPSRAAPPADGLAMPLAQKLKPAAEPRVCKWPITIRDKRVCLDSPLEMFGANRQLQIDDGFCVWKVDLSECCTFSPDGLSFCAVVGEGGMVAYALRAEGRPLDFIGSVSLPDDVVSAPGQEFTACAISSHANLMIESSKEQIFAFHVGSQTFLRTIVCATEAKFLFICDSHQLIVAVETELREVFTLNGTRVAQAALDRDEIRCAALSTGETPLLATGHYSGAVKLWWVDFAATTAKPSQVRNLETSIVALGFVENGKALVVVSRNETWLFVNPSLADAPGREPFVSQSEVLCCAAQTGGKACKPATTLCRCCRLYYCSSHCKKGSEKCSHN